MMLRVFLLSFLAMVASTAAGVGLFLLWSLLSPWQADAHDWYPRECCSGQDCEQLAAGAVKAQPDGYHIAIAAGGHKQVHAAKTWTVPYADKRIRVSPDEHYHACIQPLGYMEGYVTGGEIICLFVPGKLF